MIILEDFNAYSSEWSLHCEERRDVAGLESVIERHDLIMNNELRVATRPTRNSKTSTINLTFTTRDIVTLDA